MINIGVMQGHPVIWRTAEDHVAALAEEFIGVSLNAVSAESDPVLFWYGNNWHGGIAERNTLATKLWHELNPSGRPEPLNGWDHLCGTVIVTGRRGVDDADTLPPRVKLWLEEQ